MRELELEPGSRSSGTLAQGDLIPCFLTVLASVDEERAHSIECDPDNADWREDPETGNYMLDDLIDALSDHCPEGHYFGAHIGDSTDFGVWKVEMHGERINVESHC